MKFNTTTKRSKTAICKLMSHKIRSNNTQMWSNELINRATCYFFILNLYPKGRWKDNVLLCVWKRDRERGKERKKRWREITKQGQIAQPQNATTQRLHPKPQPKASLCRVGSTAHALRVVLWWQLHNNAGNCWWMCVVKCERSDKQTVAAASCSGANDCLSLERLHFSVIKACQSQALVWLMIQIEIKYTAA